MHGIDPIRCIHITPSVGHLSFGLGAVALNLAAHQQRLGVTVQIWCTDQGGETKELEISYGLQEQTIRCFPIFGPPRLSYSPGMESAARQENPLNLIIHQHGLWTGVSRVSNIFRSFYQVPTVVAPHGSLDPWVLNRSRWKKRLALRMYERKNLHRTASLHALAQPEAEDLRGYGLHNPIAVIPNGISEDWLSSMGDASGFRRKFDFAPDTRVMLFLSRITPKKGLPMLLEALAVLRQRLGAWKLVIAGVNEFGHQEEVQALVEKLALQSYVQLVGPLYGQDKCDAFAATELFVLPSHSEGAPVVILEALGASVPVLTTKASPWEEVVSHRCGWWTEITLDALADALRDALQQSPSTLRTMGERGKDLIRARYTWTSIVRMTIELYEWLRGRANRPSFVIT